jgi:glycosyltransferase involved in cell wall biosynthesis
LSKKIVLISSGQPSSNPRLVKEADCLAELGFEVLVIYSYWVNWAFESDKILFKKCKWQPILIGGSPFSNKILYYFTKLRFKFANFLVSKIGFNYNLTEMSKGRTYYEMLYKAKSIKADLYIAHNLSALPIAVKAAKFHKAKCGFDAEDYHRQEVNDNTNSKEYKLAKYLEDKYLLQVDYLTAASPLIANEYKKLYPKLNPIVINNVFLTRKLHSFSKSETSIPKLKLFWFSQTIGKGRGVEDIINAMGIMKNENICLTLLGQINTPTYTYLQNLAQINKLKVSQLNFLPPVNSDEIFDIASHFDIGLALEPGFCLNNNLALSNKIFTYLCAGNAVVASETKAQKQLLNSYPNIGKTYKIGDIEALANILKYYDENKEALQNAKNASLLLAKNELNWEIESEKFIKIINTLI